MLGRRGKGNISGSVDFRLIMVVLQITFGSFPFVGVRFKSKGNSRGSRRERHPLSLANTFAWLCTLRDPQSAK